MGWSDFWTNGGFIKKVDAYSELINAFNERKFWSNSDNVLTDLSTTDLYISDWGKFTYRQLNNPPDSEISFIYKFDQLLLELLQKGRFLWFHPQVYQNPRLMFNPEYKLNTIDSINKFLTEPFLQLPESFQLRSEDFLFRWLMQRYEILNLLSVCEFSSNVQYIVKSACGATATELQAKWEDSEFFPNNGANPHIYIIFESGLNSGNSALEYSCIELCFAALNMQDFNIPYKYKFILKKSPESFGEDLLLDFAPDNISVFEELSYPEHPQLTIPNLDRVKNNLSNFTVFKTVCKESFMIINIVDNLTYFDHSSNII